MSSLATNIGRGYETNQVNTSGTFDLVADQFVVPQLPWRLLPRSIQRYGHPADDVVHLSDADDGASTALLPASVQRRHQYLEHAARPDHGLRHDQALELQRRTTTTRSTRGGLHTLKGGYGFQHVVNDINSFYPGGYVFLFWDQQLRVRRPDTGPRHLRLLRSERSADHEQGRQQHPVAVCPGPVDGGQSPDAESRPPHRGRKGADLPARLPGNGLPLHVQGQAGAAARRGLRRVGRRPPEGVRQLGDVLRLDEVRAAARFVRRRNVVHLLSRPRHARSGQPEPDQHAGPRSVGDPGQLPRPPRAVVWR